MKSIKIIEVNLVALFAALIAARCAAALYEATVKIVTHQEKDVALVVGEKNDVAGAVAADGASEAKPALGRDAEGRYVRDPTKRRTDWLDQFGRQDTVALRTRHDGI